MNNNKELFDRLCPEPWSAEKEVTKEDWRAAVVAGEKLLEIGLEAVNKDKAGVKAAERTREWLAAFLQSGDLSPQERAKAGNVLSLIGDPRFDKDFWNLPKDATLGFIEIPAGKFLMGTDLFEMYIDKFYCGKYPVTVGQYEAFLADSGFKTGNPDCRKGLANHPVVWVSWYEAMEYCKWLTEKLQSIAGGKLKAAKAEGEKAFWADVKSGEYVVTLPSEPEWEKAARGTDGRIFPWGNEADPNKANYKETKIGTTTSVGCFANGASPYGVEDMSGNNWNWLRNLMGKEEENWDFRYPYDANDGREVLSAGDDVLRGMRGGAFTVEQRRARCDFRDGVLPVSRDDADGFRVVITRVVKR